MLTKKFIKNNPNVIFTRADKGNITVALANHDYKHKIINMLQDEDTYIKLKKDPTNTLTKNICELLTRWKDREYITSSTYKKVHCSDGNFPRGYGLPKIHKPNCPYRIIISSVDSPMYSLAGF